MFNAIIDNVYVLGFRILNGFILPPCTLNKKSNKYYPIIYLCQEKAEMLYDKIKFLNWEEKYSFQLRNKDESIHDLLLSAGYFSVYFG